jgi:hypothetical protein
MELQRLSLIKERIMWKYIALMFLVIGVEAADVSTRRPIVTQRIIADGVENYTLVGVSVLSQSGENSISIREIVGMDTFQISTIPGFASDFWGSEDRIQVSPPLQVVDQGISNSVIYSYRDVGKEGDPQWYRIGINDGTVWVEIVPVADEPELDRGDMFVYLKMYNSPTTNVFIRGLMPMDESFRYPWAMTNAENASVRFAPAYPVPDDNFTNGITGEYPGEYAFDIEFCDSIEGYNRVPVGGESFYWGFIGQQAYFDSEDGNGPMWFDVGNFPLPFTVKGGFDNFIYQRKSIATGTVELQQRRPY